MQTETRSILGLLLWVAIAYPQIMFAVNKGCPENFADPQTKYLTYKVWSRHLHYTHNLEGDAPERGEPNKMKKAKVAATTWTTNEPWGEQLD